MPLKEFSLTVFAAAFLPLGSSILAAATTPTANDAWAAVGAALATLIAVAEARKKDRSTWHLACVIIGSWFTGATWPAIMVHLWYPDHFAVLSWQVWAMGGFGVALVGWSIVHAFYGLGPWLARRITDEAKKKLGGKVDE